MMMMILVKLFISILICSLVYSAKRKVGPSPIELNAAKILQRASGDINMAQVLAINFYMINIILILFIGNLV
jgi:hypothetical protein